jgi:hypothetical protein
MLEFADLPSYMVLGKGKAMSYEDLEEARAKRAAKRKGKCGRKAKNTVPEAEESNR